jgi:hypothetical protein
MAVSATDGRSQHPSTDHAARVLRWTFRRNEEAIVCELGLNTDDSAYELRLEPPTNPAGVATELFNDAMAAFQRHAAIERVESERIVRS